MSKGRREGMPDSLSRARSRGDRRILTIMLLITNGTRKKK